MRRAIFSLLLIASAASASPTEGAKLSAVTLLDPQWHPRRFPDGKLPMLFLYEDKNAGKQNKHLNALLGAFTDQPKNQGKFEFVPIADVADYNWWPAKKYVLDNIRETCNRESVAVWIDWKGEARKSWGLTKGKSGVLLVTSEGEVKFAAEGPLSDAQQKLLEAKLVELGLTR